MHGCDSVVPHRAAGVRCIGQQLSTKINQIMISSADVAANAPFAPIAITGGVLADEAMALFK